MMNMANVISISGSSGVGKTTLSKVITMAIGEDRCLSLSGDDLHRWERNDPLWNFYTHLNPQANDLERGHDDLLQLSLGSSIWRKHYDHNSGKFTEPNLIEAKSVIVFEGLHAFYLEKTANLADIKIFVETDADLKKEWKINRDTKKRGYKQDEVLKIIYRRVEDEEKFILPQRKSADAIVKFTKNIDASISLNYICIKESSAQLMHSVKMIYDSMTEFILGCRCLSMESSLIQERGGNVSVKCDDKMIITSSGSKMSDVSLYRNFCICSIPKIQTQLLTDDSYNDFVRGIKSYGHGIPSMETGFHLTMPNKVVIHTHPVHLNAILCSEQSRSIISDIFNDISYQYVEYCSPGFRLFNKFISTSSVVFLENHGLVVGCENAEDAIELTENINNRCKLWLNSHTEFFVDLENHCVQDPLFPDAAVFTGEMAATNRYIYSLLIGACLVPRFLTSEQISEIKNMNFERYRKQLIQ